MSADYLNFQIVTLAAALEPMQFLPQSENRMSLIIWASSGTCMIGPTPSLGATQGMLLDVASNNSRIELYHESLIPLIRSAWFAFPPANCSFSICETFGTNKLQGNYQTRIDSNVKRLGDLPRISALSGQLVKYVKERRKWTDQKR